MYLVDMFLDGYILEPFLQERDKCAGWDLSLSCARFYDQRLVCKSKCGV